MNDQSSTSDPRVEPDQAGAADFRGDYGRREDDGPLHFSEEPLVFSDGDDRGFGDAAPRAEAADVGESQQQGVHRDADQGTYDRDTNPGLDLRTPLDPPGTQG